MSKLSKGTSWSPYSIPKTPDVGSKSGFKYISDGDPYLLSPKNLAKSDKNPSPQIEWSQVPMVWTEKELSNVVETEIPEIKKRLDSLEQTIEELQARMDALEGRIDELDAKVDALEAEVATLTNRMDNARIEASCENGNIVVKLFL